jgi:acetyltransferase
MSKILRIVRYYAANLVRGLRLWWLRRQGIVIGNNTMISTGAHLDVHRGKIIIGDNCLITHGCYIMSHDGAAKMITPGADGNGVVVIGNNVFVGVNSVILPNVTVGDNAVIAAGAVVTSDVPSATVVAGVPARIIKHLAGPFHVLNQNPVHLIK